MKKFMEYEDSKGLRGLISLDKIEFIFEGEMDDKHEIVMDTADGRIRLSYNSESNRNKEYNIIREFIVNENVILILEGVKC